MERPDEPKPWERIRGYLQLDDPAPLAEYLDSLKSDETIRALLRLTPAEQLQLILALPKDSAARLINEVPETAALEIIDDLPPGEAASIVGELPSDDVADLLGELGDQDRQEILDLMAPDEAAEARQLIGYPWDTAGGLMMTEYLAYKATTRIGSVVADLSTRTEDFPLYHLQQIYVTRPSGRLLGAVNLASIAFADPEQELGSIAEPADAVPADMPLDALEDFFEDHDQVVAPVVGERSRLIGVLRRRAVYDAITEKTDEDARRRQGIVGGEELRSLPIRIRSRRRLSWLSVNIVLNIIAASVIAAYQETLAAAIALAVFLPIVSDMSGCSGNQAAAVTLREVTLGIIRPGDIFRVWIKEAAVGMINGIALGILIGITAWLWQDKAWLGLVVGGALAINTVIAVSIGGTVPLILKGLRIDPALASGPLLTTVTDMCGFFLVLSLASLAIPVFGA